VKHDWGPALIPETPIRGLPSGSVILPHWPKTTVHDKAPRR
jgi:hypothetical protein